MVKAPNHMERAGIAPERVAERRGNALVAETWFTLTYGGTKATPKQDMKERWDVRIGRQRYDVKTVESHHSYVDGGDDQPSWPTPVVLVLPGGRCKLLGIVPRALYRLGVPRPGYDPRWFVLVDEIDGGTRLTLPVGTPLAEPRLCPSCDAWHPVGTTCASGWAPMQQALPYPWEEDEP